MNHQSQYGEQAFQREHINAIFLFIDMSLAFLFV